MFVEATGEKLVGGVGPFCPPPSPSTSWIRLNLTWMVLIKEDVTAHFATKRLK